MLATPLWHGSAGPYDEWLAFGILLALGLIVYFLSAVFRKKDAGAHDPNKKDESKPD
jgi:putative Mn2+ efflux pump MntP